jgi:GNAT superfamily N-acetyltransferase
MINDNFSSFQKYFVTLFRNTKMGKNDQGSIGNNEGNAMPYRIVEATAEHVSGICQAHREAVLGLARDHYAPGQIAAWAACMKPEKMERALADPAKSLFVALAEAEVAGFVLCEPGVVWAMYVRPRHARQGLGGNLLARAEALTRRQGLGTVRLTASLNAVAFYEANGFMAAGEDVFPLGNGLSLGCLRMEKSLVPGT